MQWLISRPHHCCDYCHPYCQWERGGSSCLQRDTQGGVAWTPGPRPPGPILAALHNRPTAYSKEAARRHFRGTATRRRDPPSQPGVFVTVLLLFTRDLDSGVTLGRRLPGGGCPLRVASREPH